MSSEQPTREKIASSVGDLRLPIDRFLRIAKETPHSAALLYPENFTYGQLLQRVAELSDRMRLSGFVAGDVAAVRARTGSESVAGCLAIWLAGGSVVPLDERTPMDRVRFILRDSNAKLILSDADLIECTREALEGTCGIVVTNAETASARAATNGSPRVSGSSVAYIIYTSGSTGKPKGVAVTQGNLANFVEARVALYGRYARMLPIHPVSFDPAMGAIAWALSTSGCLAMLTADELLDPACIAGVIEDTGVTHLSAAPSVYSSLLDAAPADSLRSLVACIVGGETLRRQVALQHYAMVPHARLVNEYGPTEATIAATAYEVPPRPPDSIPIGRPLLNVECLVLRPNGEACDTEESGELYIGGAGVAVGYVGQPALTRERFVLHPSLPNGSRFYRTGDRVRWNAQGELEFIGRMDFQIKLRGNRIEPGEIESELLDLPGLRAAAVVLRELPGGGQRLVGFFESEDDQNVEVMRERLTAVLPPHMVPSMLLRIELIPLTAAGKADRHALAEWPMAETATHPTSNPPSSDTERLICQVWAAQLALDERTIGRTDDFLALGGHSLLLAGTHQRIQRELRVQFPISALFAHTVLHDLASYVDAQSDQEDSPAWDGDPNTREYPLAPVQETFYYIAKLDSRSSAYIVGATMRISGPLDSERLRNAVAAVLERNPLLTSRLSNPNNHPSIIHCDRDSMDWRQLDVSDSALTESTITRFLHEPIDISVGPLIRFQLLTCGSDEYYFSVAAHHIAFDGISVKLFYESVWSAYRGGLAAEGGVPYIAFEAVARQRLNPMRVSRLYEYWRGKLSEMSGLTVIPYTRAQDSRNDIGSDGRVTRTISQDTTQALRELSRRYRATPFMTTLAALQLILARYTGREDIAVGAPVSVRGIGNFSETIGCMINTTVLRTRVPSLDIPFRDYLAETKETVVRMLDHSEIPFPWLIQELRPAKMKGEKSPFFSVFFNYIDRTGLTERIENLRIEPIPDPHPAAKFDLTVYMHDWGRHLEVELVYDGSRYDADTIEALAVQLESVLEQVTANPERNLTEYSLTTNEPDPPEAIPEPAFEQIHDAFLGIAHRRPDTPAVLYENRIWTYGEVETRAAKVFKTLRASGLRAGDRIAIYTDRSPELVACVVGALHAGCVFVLLDPDHAPGHTLGILTSFRPRAMLDPGSKFTIQYPEALLLQGNHIVSAEEGGRLEERSVTADGPAYAVYTSGTTGTPKGILTNHAPVSHFLKCQAETFDLRKSDRFSMLSGLSHDPIMRDIFAPLSVGACLCIPESRDRRDGHRLVSWLRKSLVTVIHATPSLAQIMIADRAHLDTLRYVFLGGEALDPRTVRELSHVARYARVINCYGLTETPQVMAWHEVTAGDDARVPIGRGIPGVTLRVVNAAGAECGPGELGEIVIESRFLAAGYINGDSIVPFDRTSNGVPMIRTGDLGRKNAHGDILYLGRNDRQVKIRGYRIELEAIESALCEQPEILHAHVVYAAEMKPPVLAAFTLSRENAVVNEAEAIHQLKLHCIEAAIPQRVIPLDRFPLNPNGKIDDRELERLLTTRPPSPEQERSSRRKARTQTEDAVVRVWSEILGRVDVGIDDDFFEIGGNSLLAVQMVARLGAELNITLPVELLIENATPARLVEALYDLDSLPEESLVVRVNESGTRPPFWMLHPVGGHVLFIRRLATLMNQEQPILGIQARGLDGSKAPIEDLRVMASLYIEFIKKHQPSGPYFIGGPSMGGRIAYEIAQQLLERGDQIALLAMFDTWAPGYPVRMRVDRWVIRKVREYVKRIHTQSFSEILTYLRSRDKFGYSRYDTLEKMESSPDNLTRTIARVISANEFASKNYQMQRYAGRITLFRAMQRPDWNAVDFSEPTNGWSRWANDVDIVPIDCTHQHIMDDAACEDVAVALTSRLNAVYQQYGISS